MTQKFFQSPVYRYAILREPRDLTTFEIASLLKATKMPTVATLMWMWWDYHVGIAHTDLCVLLVIVVFEGIPCICR